MHPPTRLTLNNPFPLAWPYDWGEVFQRVSSSTHALMHSQVILSREYTSMVSLKTNPVTKLTKHAKFRAEWSPQDIHQKRPRQNSIWSNILKSVFYSRKGVTRSWTARTYCSVCYIWTRIITDWELVGKGIKGQKVAKVNFSSQTLFGSEETTSAVRKETISREFSNIKFPCMFETINWVDKKGH